jgi:2-hydroxychromene-2-carboxylate isomerase
MREADWYFDFISPFAYFGFKRLGELPPDLKINFKPLLFAGLLEHWGQKGPAEIPPKRLWTFRSCVWYAQQHGVAFRMPAVHPFNPLRHLRLALAAGATPEAIGRIFESVWATGDNPTDDAGFEKLARSVGLSTEACTQASVKDTLRRNTEEATARGVFGVPTLLIDGEAFWGADAMAFAKAYLGDPAILRTPEMQEIANLPVGVMRKGV